MITLVKRPDSAAYSVRDWRCPTCGPGTIISLVSPGVGPVTLCTRCLCRMVEPTDQQELDTTNTDLVDPYAIANTPDPRGGRGPKHEG